MSYRLNSLKAENHVANKLSEIGYIVLFTEYDNAPYDLMIDTVDGPKRIQVKCSIRRRCDIRRSTNQGKKRYSQTDLDYFICVKFKGQKILGYYIIPNDDNIPRREIRWSTYSWFLNRWDILPSPMFYYGDNDEESVDDEEQEQFVLL